MSRRIADLGDCQLYGILARAHTPLSTSRGCILMSCAPGSWLWPSLFSFQSRSKGIIVLVKSATDALMNINRRPGPVDGHDLHDSDSDELGDGMGPRRGLSEPYLLMRSSWCLMPHLSYCMPHEKIVPDRYQWHGMIKHAASVATATALGCRCLSGRITNVVRGGPLDSSFTPLRSLAVRRGLIGDLRAPISLPLQCRNHGAGERLADDATGNG